MVFAAIAAALVVLELELSDAGNPVDHRFRVIAVVTEDPRDE